MTGGSNDDTDRRVDSNVPDVATLDVGDPASVATWLERLGDAQRRALTVWTRWDLETVRWAVWAARPRARPRTDANKRR